MNNANNKFIALTYKLYVDGDHGKEMVEEAKADRPFYKWIWICPRCF